MLKSIPCMCLKFRTEVVAALAAVTAAGLGSQTASAQFDADDVIRLNKSEPIIERDMFPSNRRSFDGNNINGPSMIRVPDWIPGNQRAGGSSTRYYLYFGHHDGSYIRMAYSRDAFGPFSLYRADAPVGSRGVFDDNNSNINIDQGISLRRNHIASPDVHVDNDAEEIILYFHTGGPYRFNGQDTDQQRTWVNTSDDGLTFRRGDVEPVNLGPSYFKVFENRSTLYAVHNDGGPVRARSFNNPWAPTNNYYNGNSLASLWESRSTNNLIRNAVSGSRRVRHSGVRTNGNNLQLFYSIRGDSPERIAVSNISLGTNWNNWTVNIPGNELLRAVGGWEGGHRTPSPSQSGQQTNVNQLRDPDVFQDNDGSLYLFYTGSGEEALGVAALQSSRQRIRTNIASHDAETRQGNRSNSNFRSSSTMVARGGSGNQDRRVHLRFPTPGGGTVRAAVVRVYLPNNESGNLDIYGVGSFNESSITGSNRPSQTTSRLDRVRLGYRGFYELDVTDYVNDNRSGNINLVIRTSNNSSVQILSSENSNFGRRPQMKWMQRQ